MQRTQVLLESGQYEALKARSRREAKSLSKLVREAVDAFLGRSKPAESRLSDICGIGKDPSRASGADHDHYLYGWKKGE